MNDIDKNIRDAAKKELAELENLFKETNAAEINKACKDMFALYKGFIDAGFDNKQALALLIGAIQGAIHNQKDNGGNRNENPTT